ncbi:helicase-related protein [Paraburkholderia sediminicola]|uniref:helicase-related protein n=1 Tax=Paraburkholderia sediminicola TaxID=458836 RepID=UPI0038BBFE6E
MKQSFSGWAAVARNLREIAAASASTGWLNEGQRASLNQIAQRLPDNGVVIADEVGMGKTRIATAVSRSVIQAGGRVAILVPPGLPFQWKAELADAGIKDVPLLRSLWQYLRAWDTETQDEPQPWFDHNVIVISQAFANWRLGEKSDPWRWALLPELYARWYKHRKAKVPYGFHRSEELYATLPRAAAGSIFEGIVNASGEFPRQLIEELFAQTPWPGALDAGAYQRDAQLRPWLERAVGLGLGTFDLVIVDEAHKSRGAASILSSLLDRVVLRNESSRCLAMTATPVELDVTDWKTILKRIGVDSDTIADRIDAYARAVKEVRQTPLDAHTRHTYKLAADRFHAALHPFLLRRDKREDEYVRSFAHYAKEPTHAYRRETEIVVDTASLEPSWKRAVCAAEALSVMMHQSKGQQAKRLRLTLGNGHGIAALLRLNAQDAPCDVDTNQAKEAAEEPGAEVSEKRDQRAAWWMNVLAEAFSRDGDELFDHPAILAAIKEIEAICDDGEKVLVFGRFTAPMRALVDLLNARAMLASLAIGQSWPQTTLSDSEWAAAQAAHRQLCRQGELQREALESELAAQYKDVERKRRSFRSQLLAQLEAGLAGHAGASLAKQLFAAFKKTIADAVADDETSQLALVARAMQEWLGSDEQAWQPRAFADAFVELVDASVDRGDDDEGDTELDEGDAMTLWTRVVDELNSPQGGFARLMNGDTSPRTRRLLQLAFNREHSFPKVLVAQSLVGREGLNLHKACRTVVLLHPEWNPGVVEQQIGRVDRIGSLWQKSLEKSIEDKVEPDKLPRIEIRPVIFKGTYDEWNWTVLRERWDDLRAQLQGVVISPATARRSAVPPEIVEEINGAAPNFSPR